MNPSRLVHIVEDDASMRTSLTRLLRVAGHEVITYGSAEELLAAVSPSLSGCLLLDLRLPGMGGLELQEALAARGCLAPIVFLTAHGDVSESVRAMKRGAVDFLQKPVVADELLAAVSAALARGVEVRRHRDELAHLQARVDTLTDREREVWLRVVRGQLNKQIAYDLGIVERTVKLHRSRAMEKLQAQSTADLVLFAERLHLIDDAPR